MSTRHQDIEECYRHINLPKPHWQKYQLHASTDTIEKLILFINGQQDEHFGSIFKKHVPLLNDPDYVYDSLPDPLRLQLVLPEEIAKKEFKEVDEAIVRVIRPFLPGIIPRHHAILWSRPGGKAQSKHADFEELTCPRSAAIISIDNGTKLEIRNIDNEWITLKIAKGEMVVFRGDVEHRGSGYTKSNRRLYVKLIPAGAELFQVEKDAVSAPFLCPKCKKAIYPKQLQNHKKNYRGKTDEEIALKKSKNAAKTRKYRAKKAKLDI